MSNTQPFFPHRPGRPRNHTNSLVHPWIDDLHRFRPIRRRGGGLLAYLACWGTSRVTTASHDKNNPTFSSWIEEKENLCHRAREIFILIQILVGFCLYSCWSFIGRTGGQQVLSLQPPDSQGMATDTKEKKTGLPLIRIQQLTSSKNVIKHNRSQVSGRAGKSYSRNAPRLGYFSRAITSRPRWLRHFESRQCR